jgi:hypothetical protein
MASWNGSKNMGFLSSSQQVTASSKLDLNVGTTHQSECLDDPRPLSSPELSPIVPAALLRFSYGRLRTTFFFH